MQEEEEEEDNDNIEFILSENGYDISEPKNLNESNIKIV